ncbi:MAG: TerC family protein [Myxococcota bacterium]
MESIGHPAIWIGFIVFVLAMLAIDLGVFNRKAHVVSVREATTWSLVWVGLSLVFAAGMFAFADTDSGVEFLTGYVIEKSLSIDNIFVFVIIFQRMKIPAELQHRVLFWGVLGAIALRAIMIFAGATLLQHFHWLIYIFGAFLVITGFRIFREWQKGSHDEEETESGIMRVVKRFVRTTPELRGNHFFVRDGVRRLATPLFLTLVLVELSDVVFALDSIPAIFAITLDPFIVFTSNIFAIMGLRSLYFLLGPMLDKFQYLKVGLSAVLAFVGLKMILGNWVHIAPPLSLAVIAVIIGVSIWFSVRHAARDARETGPPAAP